MYQMNLFSIIIWTTSTNFQKKFKQDFYRRINRENFIQTRKTLFSLEVKQN